MALKTLSENREILDATAQQLLESEVLEGEMLREKLSQLRPPAELSEWLQIGSIPEGEALPQLV